MFRAKLNQIPSTKRNTRLAFDIDVDADVPAFSSSSELVPNSNPNFRFDKNIAICILAGLIYNKRTLIVGEHGIGKSAHIEQVCSRLN